MRNEDDCPDYITKLLPIEAQISGLVELAVMEALTWYVHFIIEKRKGAYFKSSWS